MTANKYYVVLDFMVEQLELKGTELAVFAIIYGFSQAKGRFTGSLKYLQDWTGTTKQGIIKILDRLIEKNYIVKKETYYNNIKFTEYETNVENWTREQISLPPVNKVYHQSTEFTTGKQSLPNNINNNYIKENNNISKDIYIKEKEIAPDLVKEVVDYLNLKTNKNFRPNNQKTISLINSRVKDGYNLDDFKKVIDNKCAEWLQDINYNQYLRPDTLFGNKFEGYLNQSKPLSNNQNSNRYYQQETENQEVNLSNEELEELYKNFG